MNKHATLPNLMQKLVSDEEIQRIAEAVGDRDSSRTFLRCASGFTSSCWPPCINGKAFATEPMWGLCMDCRDSINLPRHNTIDTRLKKKCWSYSFDT